MPRWNFLVVRQHEGSVQRQQTCARIKLEVEQHGLSDILPLVKYERGKKQEHYLGIAYDANAWLQGSNAEMAAREVLMAAGVASAKHPLNSFVIEANDVANLHKLLNGTLECDSFTLPITYDITRDVPPPSSDQLFAELDAAELIRGEPDPIDIEKHSRLLEWCSAAGSGELVRIQQACLALGISSEWGGAWSVLRRLVLLGHLEFSSGSLRWSAIPPTLVATDEDADCRILVGQRTQGMIEFLRNESKVDEHPQPDGPSRLVVHGDPEKMCYRQGRRLHDAGCVARELSKLLPRVGDWVLRLPTWDEQDFRRFTIEYYEPRLDQFHEISRINMNWQPGLYRFTFEQPRVVTLGFFDDNDGRWLCGDYYGLRFLARARSSGCRAILRPDTHQLVIPQTDRWPMPYERALVLASGALPQRIQTDQGGLLAYQGITKPLAEKLCTLLGLELEAS